MRLLQVTTHSLRDPKDGLLWSSHLGITLFVLAVFCNEDQRPSMDNTEKATDHFHQPPESPDNWSKEDNERILEGWSHHEQKKLIRRVDFRLIPICGLLYCVSLLDRTNLSNAVIAGMGEELVLTNVNGVDRYVCDRALMEFS